jgi:ankyrin repeat protein
MKKLLTYNLFENMDDLHIKRMSEQLLTAIVNKKPIAYIETLISNGADVNYNNSKALDTPFLTAGVVKDINIMDCLLKHGADINGVNKDGETALMLSILHNDFDIFNFLIKKGADVNIITKWSSTAIHYACRFNDTGEYVKPLIDAGSNLDVQDNSGFAAIHYAINNDFDRLIGIKELIKAGANLTLKNNIGKDFIMIINNEFTDTWSWLETYEAQKLILSKAPVLYKSFKWRGIDLDPEIEEEFKYLDSASDLNLI